MDVKDLEFKLDPTKKPKEIDLIEQGGPFRGKPFAASMNSTGILSSGAFPEIQN